jgi:hypothetical protein
MELREVKTLKFDIGIEEKILDSVKKIPQNVFKVVEAHGNSLIKDK